MRWRMSQSNVCPGTGQEDVEGTVVVGVAVVDAAVVGVVVVCVVRAEDAVDVASQAVAVTVTANSSAHMPPRSTNGLTTAGYLPLHTDLAEGCPQRACSPCA